MCGLKWANNTGTWDGTTGVGQQMAVMEVVLANMIQQAGTPVTNSTGGTSVGNPAAGGGDDGRNDHLGWHYAAIDNGDLAGAVFVTFVILSALLAAVVFMFADETRTTGQNWDAFQSTLSFKSGIGGNAGATVLVHGGGNATPGKNDKSISNEDAEHVAHEGNNTTGSLGPPAQEKARGNSISILSISAPVLTTNGPVPPTAST